MLNYVKCIEIALGTYEGNLPLVPITWERYRG